MKKIIVPALIAMVAVFIVSVLIGYLFNFLVPSLKLEYENTSIFRPMNDPIMMIYFVFPLIFSLVLAWIWDKTKNLLQGSYLSNSLKFSFAFWLVASLPGMIMSLSSFKISIIMVLSWTISTFCQAFVAALVFGKMNK